MASNSPQKEPKPPPPHPQMPPASTKTSFPNISIRDYIHWKGGRAQEPTSTLVLTSSQSLYVDIRILNPIRPQEPALPNEGAPITRLEWGFAGTSSTFLIPGRESKTEKGGGGGEEGVKHSTWQHWVDSRIPSTQWDSNTEVDEGDMYPQPDGRTLEKGEMIHPSTGHLTPYAEMWRDVEPTICGIEQAKYCVVLTISDDQRRIRGMIVRVGQWCQGLLMCGEEITVERWEYVAVRKNGLKGEEVDGDWTRRVRLGERFMPCSLAFKNLATLRQGDVANYGNMEWVVREVYDWL